MNIELQQAAINRQPAVNTLIVKHFEVLAYDPVWRAMKEFAACKLEQTDELWVLQHQPVYTRGLRCKETPLAQAAHIPVLSVDRGGLMTYHGPGQIVLYALIDIKRKGINIKQVVHCYEQTVINFLKSYTVDAERIEGAPGVYIQGRKIASVGIRVRNHKTYHGLSVNFDLDLTPFNWINTCGYKGLEVVQLADLIDDFCWISARDRLVDEFVNVFDYTMVNHFRRTTI